MTTTEASAGPGPREAAIHDLGYKPYRGQRLPQATRYRVIARNLLASALRGWWRTKLWYGLAVIGAVVSGGFLYAFMFMASLANEPLPTLMVSGARGFAIDLVLPEAFDFFTMLAFVLGLTNLSATVANDMRAGAFEFYFSRAVRPRDYLLGKLAGAMLVIGVVTLVAPLLVALVQLGLTLGDHNGTAATAAGNLFRLALVGALATLVYAAIPLAVGGLVRKRSHAIAIYAALYLLVPAIPLLIAKGTGIAELAAIDLKHCLMSVMYALFEISFTHQQELLVPVWLAALSIAGQVGLALGFLYWKVRSTERSGIGGNR